MLAGAAALLVAPRGQVSGSAGVSNTGVGAALLSLALKSSPRPGLTPFASFPVHRGTAPLRWTLSWLLSAGLGAALGTSVAGGPVFDRRVIELIRLSAFPL